MKNGASLNFVDQDEKPMTISELVDLACDEIFDENRGFFAIDINNVISPSDHARMIPKYADIQELAGFIAGFAWSKGYPTKFRLSTEQISILSGHANDISNWRRHEPFITGFQHSFRNRVEKTNKIDYFVYQNRNIKFDKHSILRIIIEKMEPIDKELAMLFKNVVYSLSDHILNALFTKLLYNESNCIIDSVVSTTEVKLLAEPSSFSIKDHELMISRFESEAELRERLLYSIYQ